MKKIPLHKKLARGVYDPRSYRAEKNLKKQREGFSKEIQKKAIEKSKICKVCGRPLKTSVVHHHKNFNRSDNHLRNDMPLHDRCHRNLHKKDYNARVKIGYEFSYAPPAGKSS